MLTKLFEGIEKNVFQKFLVLTKEQVQVRIS